MLDDSLERRPFFTGIFKQLLKRRLRVAEDAPEFPIPLSVAFSRLRTQRMNDVLSGNFLLALGEPDIQVAPFVGHLPILVDTAPLLGTASRVQPATQTENVDPVSLRMRSWLMARPPQLSL